MWQEHMGSQPREAIEQSSLADSWLWRPLHDLTLQIARRYRPRPIDQRGRDLRSISRCLGIRHLDVPHPHIIPGLMSLHEPFDGPKSKAAHAGSQKQPIVSLSEAHSDQCQADRRGPSLDCERALVEISYNVQDRVVFFSLASSGIRASVEGVFHYLQISQCYDPGNAHGASLVASATEQFTPAFSCTV
jgi:hypothetical protein